MGLDYDNWSRTIIVLLWIFAPILSLRVFVYYYLLKDKVKDNLVGFSLNNNKFSFNIGRLFDSIILSFFGPLLIVIFYYFVAFNSKFANATEVNAYYIGIFFLLILIFLEIILLRKLVHEKENYIWIYIKVFLVTIPFALIIAFIVFILVQKILF